jgi:hypothetical protein
MDVLHARGRTLGEVLAEPEQDAWRYSGRPSLVCSALTVALMKARDAHRVPCPVLTRVGVCVCVCRPA